MSTDLQMLTEAEELREENRQESDDKRATNNDTSNIPFEKSDGETVEQENSLADEISRSGTDVIPETETDDVTNLQPLKPIGQNLRFSKSAKILVVYGIISILLGAAAIGCGVGSFFLLPNFESRHSFQIEWKWTNLILLISGAGAIQLVLHQTMTSICGALICSLMAISMGGCTFVVHIVNLYFRRRDAEYYRAHHPQHVDVAVAIGTINVALLLIGLLAGIVSFLQFRHCLHIAGKNFGFSVHVEKHRMKLSIFGMAQLFSGLLITAWWVAVEALFQGSNVNLHALPTSEVLAHGLVISSAGYVQMMATSKGSQPLLVCAAVLNGASFLLATFFAARPLSLLYMVVDMSRSTMQDAFDVKFGLGAILVLVYILQIIFSLYSLIKFMHLAAGDRISRIDSLLEKPRKLLLACSWSHVVLGSLYSILEIVAVGLLFAYKLDFSPLPLFIISCGVFGYGAVRMGSAALLAATAAVAGLCCAFSTRDIYLFAYHAISRGDTPADADENMGFQRMQGGNLAVHFIIALLALAELALSILTLFAYLRALATSVTCLYNRREFVKYELVLKVITVATATISALLPVLGFVLFVNKLPFLELLGDYSITTGILMAIASVLGVMAAFSKISIIIVPAMFAQLITFTLIWQQSDEFAYLVHYYLDKPPSNGSVGMPAAGLATACVVLVLLLMYWLLAAISLFLQGAILEESQFSKSDFNPAVADELITMSSNPTAESALADFQQLDNDFCEKT